MAKQFSHSLSSLNQRNREENQAWANNLGENHSTVLQRLADIERAQLEEQSKYKQIELARLQKRVDKLKEELLEREAKYVVKIKLYSLLLRKFLMNNLSTEK
tara:strand:- start:2199 stop:2504 length:306 start_codon:yes stop_codon:yes gene_type:complete